MATKRRTVDTSDGDDPKDGDYNEGPRPKKKCKDTEKEAKKPKIKEPKTKAEIISRATEIATDEAAARDRLDQVDSGVLEKIKKALALGNHEATSEGEARAALRMATRLLEKHNVTQADILSQETDREKLKRAGTSIVSVRSTAEKKKRVNVEHWCSELSYAMTIFFDCQSYNTAFGSRVDWCFYGLAEQTVTAALAFEMTYNLILAWSLMSSVKTGKHQKNCYRMGVADGLINMARREKKQEKKEAHRREQALLQSRRDAEKADELARISRLNGPVKAEADVTIDAREDVDGSDPAPKDTRAKVEEVEDEDARRNIGGNAPKQQPSLFENNRWTDSESSLESSDDMSDDDFGNLAQLDVLAPDFHGNDDIDELFDLDAIKPGIKERHPSTLGSTGMCQPSSTVPTAEQKAKKQDEDDGLAWNSVGQLVAFRDSSVAIAEDYLKSQGIKLKSGRKRTFTIKNDSGEQLYHKGREDAKRIDVRRKLLENADGS